jgi:general secretion pathway protein F
MATFRYSAYTTDGRVKTGELDAVSSDEATNVLVSRGLTPFETEAVNRKSAKRTNARFTVKDLAPFMRELATLLEAELPLDDTLRILGGRSNNPRNARLAALLLDDVRAGSALSYAVERHAIGAPSYVVSLIKAGEARGRLAATLTEIARLLEARADIDGRVKAALTYPLILFAIASGTMTIVLIYLFPALIGLFEDSGVEPPGILALARDMTATVRQHWVVLVVICCAGVVAVATWLRRKTTDEFFDRWLLRLPVIGELRRQSSIAAMARTLGILLRNGVPLVQALQIAEAVVPSRSMATALATAVVALKEGDRLADALARHGALPDIVVRLVAVGEASGRLDVMLLHLADMSGRDALRSVERAMTFLSPAITICVGLMVGGIVLSVMQAILSVNSLAVR